MNTTLIRREVHFTGRVHGVGFRYTTRQIAQGYEVTGQVKNLSDGRVQLIVEGPEGEVQAFVDEIRSQMSHYIKDAQSGMLDGPSQYRDFHIG